MASNEIPKTPIERVLALAEDMADGAQAHGPAINLLQNTAAAIRAELAGYTAAEAAYQAARTQKGVLTRAAQSADSNAKAFLAGYKKVLSFTLGDEWSTAWIAAGFPGPSLALPNNAADRLGFLPATESYLLANPGKENAALGITAAAATACREALSAARSAVHDGNTVVGQKKVLREAAVDNLRARMIGLVRELGQLIDGDDPRWYAFGLNRPDDPSTPAVPDALVLTAGGPGLVLADWAPARRAERYKVQTFDAATGQWTENQQTTSDAATLTDLASGTTLRVRILAANPAGDSQPSAEAQITVP